MKHLFIFLLFFFLTQISAVITFEHSNLIGDIRSITSFIAFLSFLGLTAYTFTNIKSSSYET